MAIDPNSSAAAANPPRPPPPPQPPSSSATRPVSPQIVHPIPIPVRLPPSSSSSSSPSTWAPYPVASSGGRGFRPLPSDQTVTVANPAATAAFSHPSAAHVVRSLPLPYIQQPTPPQQKQYNHPNHVPSKGLAVSNAQPPKVASPSVPETNGYKDMREKCRDDIFSVVRDRKVRIMEGRSLYAHCRSWLRNGFHEESQPLYGSAVRSLPKPSPIPMANTNPLEKEGEHEAEGGIDDTEEDEESVEHLSTEDLFKRHVKRAKKVRARLREVRLKRIARYKSRLALLLPPLVEQFRNDASAGGT